MDSYELYIIVLVVVFIVTGIMIYILKKYCGVKNDTESFYSDNVPPPTPEEVGQMELEITSVV